MFKARNKKKAVFIVNFFMKEAPFRANQWTGFDMIGISVMKELNLKIFRTLDLCLYDWLGIYFLNGDVQLVRAQNFP